MEKKANLAQTHRNLNRVHLLISTGQNIANLIPLLELADEEDDIVIISSTFTEKSGLTGRLIDLLHKKQYRRINKIVVGNEEIRTFHKLHQKIYGYFSDLNVKKDLYFYLNGGQKVGVLATNDAVSGMPVTYVYMDTRPAAIYLISKTNTEKLPIKNTIQLEDILHLYGSGIKEGEKIYSENQFNLRSLKYPENILNFGKDERFTTILLEMIQELNKKHAQDTDKLLDDGRYVHWLRQKANQTLLECRDNIFSQVDALITDIHKKKNINVQKIKTKIYNYLHNFFNRMISLPKNEKGKYLKYLKEPLQISEEDLKILSENGVQLQEPIQSFPFGQFFENVVMWRLIKFLKSQKKYLQQISEIWMNVKFQDVNNIDKVSGEYDILIVLKTGLLIALECKSYDFSEKDLFARIARLTRRGGLLSEFWVVLPVFTHEKLLSFLNKQIFLYKNLLEMNIKIIPFTMDSQNKILKLSDMGDAVLEVPYFEEQLKQYF